MKSKIRLIVVSLAVLFAAAGQAYAAGAQQQARDLVKAGPDDGRGAPMSSTVFDGARPR